MKATRVARRDEGYACGSHPGPFRGPFLVTRPTRAQAKGTTLVERGLDPFAFRYNTSPDEAWASKGDEIGHPIEVTRLVTQSKGDEIGHQSRRGPREATPCCHRLAT